MMDEDTAAFGGSMPVNSLRAGLVTIIIRCHCLRRFARQIRTNPTLKPAPLVALRKSDILNNQL
jgi:hypothetical protein